MSNRKIICALVVGIIAGGIGGYTLSQQLDGSHAYPGGVRERDIETKADYARMGPIFDWKDPTPCRDTNSSSSAYYKFKKINIIFTAVPDPTRKLPEGRVYPSILIYDVFKEKLVETVKVNFAPCLKNEAGIEKSIAVHKYIEMSDEEKKDIHNRDNLSIIIGYGYVPEHGYGERDHGFLHYYMYRPGIKDLDAMIPYMGNSFGGSFVADASGSFDTKVLTIIKTISPRSAAGPSWIVHRSEFNQKSKETIWTTLKSFFGFSGEE